MSVLRGVVSLLAEWFCNIFRWIWREEKLALHFLQRFMTVERRLQGHDHWVFPLRFLRYAVHHYHLLPSWLRLSKLLLLVALILWQPVWKVAEETRQRDTLYGFYYRHGVQHYTRYTSAKEAARLADSYAREFVSYYQSPTYKEALRSALPTAPTPVLVKAAAKALPEIREMNIAAVGIELIRYFESLRLTPYRDPVGKFTIGYGHLMRRGEEYTALTKAQALALLRKDIAVAELVVKRHVKVPLTVSQFSSLVSLVYNIGEYQFRTSTLLKVINRANYTQAAEEIRRWEKAGGMVLPGLTKRRYAEYLLFTGKWRRPT